MRAVCSHVLVSLLSAVSLLGRSPAAEIEPLPAHNAGALTAVGAEGQSLGACPLVHTDVDVRVSGPLARVTVVQQFTNPFQEKIEAIYTFPLSHRGAVDRMRIRLGERVIDGVVQEKQQARATYEEARRAGKLAALLDQQRPNVFQQSVANVLPGEKISVAISYTETVQWRGGEYQFDFPLVVGPRYIPGNTTGPAAVGGESLPTDKVPDADRITPPVTPAQTRAGHEISLTVHLDAALPIVDIQSDQHAVETSAVMGDPSQVDVRLARQDALLNRDFVLRWRTKANGVKDALLTHTDRRGKFFTLVLEPPTKLPEEKILPREIIFVVDKSGSMRGFPLETAKQAMRKCIANLRPEDTFNVMTFEGGVGFCFASPVANTPENRAAALHYLENLQGSGGTEMMQAVEACLAGEAKPERLRIVCFLTDGFVGNDMAIIDAVRKQAGVTRVFPFGIGTSVNRFLIDGMARAGRGEAEILLSRDGSDEAVSQFYERIRSPLLANIQLEFAGIEVEEVYPRDVPDLFDAQPVIITGRYVKGGTGKLTLRGDTAKGKFERVIDIELPDEHAANDALAAQWARAKVDHLLTNHWGDVQHQRLPDDVKSTIVNLGVNYRLLTEYTSFVAIEHQIQRGSEAAKQVTVPVELPQGVSREGVFGNSGGEVDELAMRVSQLDLLRKTLVSPANDLSAAQVTTSRFSALGNKTVPRSDMFSTFGAFSGSALEGRGSAQRRAALVSASGGNNASESAVSKSLRWLTSRQMADGGWSFDHNQNVASGGLDCPNPGTLDARNGATGLALLPFLGAGQTHKEGRYKKQVYAGLAYLIKNMRVSGKAGSCEDKAAMLSHAWATLALSEAYAMTHDKELLAPAQLCLNCLVARQDTKNGGWQSSDNRQGLVLSAWCLLALKSGQMAYLNVPKDSILGARKFLDSRAAEEGQYRRYQNGAPDQLASAAALLCGMHLGWKQNHPPLVQGATAIAKTGPSLTDPRWNFLATNVMIQFKNDNWKQWNTRLRTSLVGSQADQGVAAGSWFFPDGDGAHSGGRLYHTALTALTLEVYYRHLPIYRQADAEPFQY